MNERNYDRYRRYGMQFDSDVFRMNLRNGVNIGMPIKGRHPSSPGSFGYDLKITIWAGGTEAPDQPARGDWITRSWRQRASPGTRRSCNSCWTEITR